MQSPSSNENYRTQVVTDPAEIGEAAWTNLTEADAQANPFTSYAFLHALHTTGCASARTGWAPRFLTLWHGTELAAAAPLYVKAHSYGEYVFDWAWAEASERSGRNYYPKWLVAVPFTPVGGSRLLARDARSADALADRLAALGSTTDLSSLHVLLAPDAQVAALKARGALIRRTIQFHWKGADDRTFDGFLARLEQPKRKKIRAERRKVQEAGVTLDRVIGADITSAHWNLFYRCYARTYALHGSEPYLSEEFFQCIGQSMPQNLVLIIARQDGRPIASALGVFDRSADGGKGRLYGRYWGALADISCLHFECCYYQMIDFAIVSGLSVFEGGAQGAHKLARGLDPVAVGSAHWLTDNALREAVARHLKREAEGIDQALDELDEHRAFKDRAKAATDVMGELAAPPALPVADTN